MTNLYNKKFVEIFSKPSISNEYVNSPALFKILGDVRNKKILDLGCGNGYWLRKLIKKGAACTGVDNSSEQLEVAKELNKDKKISFIKKDIMKPFILKEKYDIALLAKIIVEEPSKKKILEIIKNARNMLKADGRLIILDLHPFAPSFQDTIKVSKSYNYFDGGAPIIATSTRIDGKKVYYHDHHWIFADFFDFLQDRFLVKKITEHRCTLGLVKRFPSLENRLKKPMDIIIEAVKV